MVADEGDEKDGGADEDEEEGLNKNEEDEAMEKALLDQNVVVLDKATSKILMTWTEEVDAGVAKKAEADAGGSSSAGESSSAGAAVAATAAES